MPAIDKSEVDDELAANSASNSRTENEIMNKYNSCKRAGRAIVGALLALLLGCVAAFAGGLGTRADLFLPSTDTVVGSVSAKNSKLGNFVTDVSLQSKDTAGHPFVVDVLVLDSNGKVIDDIYAGTFTTSTGGKGGVLYVNDTPVQGDFMVEVSDMDSGSAVLYAESPLMHLP